MCSKRGSFTDSSVECHLPMNIFQTGFLAFWNTNNKPISCSGAHLKPYRVSRFFALKQLDGIEDLRNLSVWRYSFVWFFIRVRNSQNYSSHKNDFEELLRSASRSVRMYWRWNAKFAFRTLQLQDVELRQSKTTTHSLRPSLVEAY